MMFRSYCRDEVNMLVICLENLKVSREKNQNKVVIQACFKYMFCIYTFSNNLCSLTYYINKPLKNNNIF